MVGRLHEKRALAFKWHPKAMAVISRILLITKLSARKKCFGFDTGEEYQ